MTVHQFEASFGEQAPAPELSAPLRALWWDAKGDWTKAHAQVDDLETPQAMAVHAYLHRREGDLANARYWYRRAGVSPRRDALEAEWTALAEELLIENRGATGPLS